MKYAEKEQRGNKIAKTLRALLKTSEVYFFNACLTKHPRTGQVGEFMIFTMKPYPLPGQLETWPVREGEVAIFEWHGKEFEGVVEFVHLGAETAGTYKNSFVVPQYLFLVPLGDTEDLTRLLREEGFSV